MMQSDVDISCAELSEEQLKTTNGCGSSYWMAWIFRVPKWVSKSFFRCCNRHDIKYQSKVEKAIADDELYDCMYYSAFHGPLWQKNIKITFADLIYLCLNTKMSNVCFKKA